MLQLNDQNNLVIKSGNVICDILSRGVRDTFGDGEKNGKNHKLTKNKKCDKFNEDATEQTSCNAFQKKNSSFTVN